MNTAFKNADFMLVLQFQTGKTTNAGPNCALWTRKNNQRLTDLRSYGAEKSPTPDRSAPSGREKTTNP
jgi:hypothetical protein